MDITEIREKRTQLAQRIHEMIQAFERETECSVKSVRLHHVALESTHTYVVGVDVEAEIG